MKCPDSQEIDAKIESDCECYKKILAVDDQEFNLIPIGVFLKKQFEITVTKSKDGS